MTKKNNIAFAALICSLFGTIIPAQTYAAGTQAVMLNRGLGEELSASLTGTYAINIGDSKMAARAFERAWLKNQSNYEAFSRAVQAYMISGDLDNAIKLSKAGNEQIRGANSDLLLANEAFALGKTKQVIDLLQDRSFSNDGRALYARHLLAWAYAYDGNKEKALELANTKSGNRELDKNAYYSRALIYQYLGMNEDALAAYETGFGTGAKTSIGLVSYAEYLAQNGEKQKALDLLRSIPPSHEANYWLNETYQQIENGKFKKLKGKSLKTTQKLAARALGNIGLAISNNPKLGSPLGEILMANAIDNEILALKINAASFMIALKLEDDSIKLLKTIPQNNIFGDQANALIASIKFENDKAESVAILENAVKARPNYYNRINLASYYLSSEKYEAAKVLYDTLLQDADKVSEQELGINKWQLYFGRSNAFIGQKNYMDAIKDLKEANRLEPENPILLNSLGFTLADSNLELENAQDLLQRAVMKRPNSGETIDSLGWVLYRAGKYEEALDWLERAITLSPAIGEIADHLGDAYWKTNRKEEARLEWKKAISLYKSENDKKRIAQKLENGLLDPANQAIIAQN